MPNAIQTQVNRFVDAEPAIAASGAAAVVAYVLAQLATLGVITDVQASTDTRYIVPPVTALLVVVLGFLVRTLVMPAARFAEKVETEVESRVGDILAKNPQVAALAPLVEGAAGHKLLAEGLAEVKATLERIEHAPMIQGVLLEAQDAVKDVTGRRPSPAHAAEPEPVPAAVPAPEAAPVTAEQSAADDAEDGANAFDAPTDDLDTDVPTAEDAFTAADDEPAEVDVAPEPATVPTPTETAQVAPVAAVAMPSPGA